jgi:hypothetical protein
MGGYLQAPQVARCDRGEGGERCRVAVESLVLNVHYAPVHGES